MMPNPTRGRGLLLAAGTAGISGVAVFVNGYGVQHAPDATIYTTAKNLVAAVVLAAALGGAVLRRPSTRPATELLSRRWYGLLAIAVVGGSVPFVLFFEGLARASSEHAAFLHKTLVVWVALLAVPLLGERLRSGHYAAIGLLLIGQAVLDGGLDGFGWSSGELLILAATWLWAVEVIVVKHLVHEVPPELLAVARMGLGAVLLVGWVALSGRWSALTSLGVAGWGWALLTGLLLAGYVSTWYRALRLAPATDVTAMLVLAVLVTSLLDAISDGALPASDLAWGGVLLVVGAGLVAAARPAPAAVPGR